MSTVLPLQKMLLNHIGVMTYRWRTATLKPFMSVDQFARKLAGEMGAPCT